MSQREENTLPPYLGPQARLILIGAGDRWRFLSQMALSLDFEVFVCNPREEHRASWNLPGVPLTHGMPDDRDRRHPCRRHRLRPQPRPAPRLAA